MSQHQFKVGDKVQLVDDSAMSANIGAVAKVVRTDYEYIYVRWLSNCNDQMDGGYSPNKFKLYVEPTLADKLAEAKAEVARLEKELVEQNQVKVGESFDIEVTVIRASLSTSSRVVCRTPWGDEWSITYENLKKYG